MNFGDKIKSARKAKKLTQRQFAELIGAKHNSISNWENNQNKPDPDTIERICGVLEITPSYLLGIGEEQTISKMEKVLLDSYNKLNDIGKKEAIKRVSELAEIPKYCNVVELPDKKDDVEEDKSYLEPLAAHGEMNENNVIDQRDLDDMDNW